MASVRSVVPILNVTLSPMPSLSYWAAMRSMPRSFFSLGQEPARSWTNSYFWCSVVVAHLHDALAPCVIGMQLVQKAHAVVWLDALDARHAAQVQQGVAIDRRGQNDVDVGRHDGLMRPIHLGAHHVRHAEHGTDGKHARGNAQDRQERARLVVPEIEPDLVPEYAHLRSRLLAPGAPPRAPRPPCAMPRSVTSDCPSSSFNWS